MEEINFVEKLLIVFIYKMIYKNIPKVQKYVITNRAII